MGSYGNVAHAALVPDLTKGSLNPERKHVSPRLPQNTNLDLQTLAQRRKHLGEDDLLVPHWVCGGLLGGGPALRGQEM